MEELEFSYSNIRDLADDIFDGRGGVLDGHMDDEAPLIVRKLAAMVRAGESEADIGLAFERWMRNEARYCAESLDHLVVSRSPERVEWLRDDNAARLVDMRAVA